MKRMRVVYFLFLLIMPAFLWAQEITVYGKVTDAASGDPVPFANVGSNHRCYNGF